MIMMTQLSKHRVIEEHLSVKEADEIIKLEEE